MRQTRGYTASQYAHDSGFPLVWIIRLFTRRARKGIEEEAEEYHQRKMDGQQRKIIGRVAGPEAFTGKSAVRIQQQSCDKVVSTEQKHGDLQSKPSSRA